MHRMNFKTWISFWWVYLEIKQSVSLVNQRRGRWWCFINALLLMKWNKVYPVHGQSTCFPWENPCNWVMCKQQSEQRTRGDTSARGNGSI